MRRLRKKRRLRSSGFKSVTFTVNTIITNNYLVVINSTLYVYTDGKAREEYVDFSNVTSLTYNGQTFTSNQE